MAKKNKAPISTAANWMANVGKSLGYSAAERFGNHAVATKSIYTAGKDIYSEAKDYINELSQAKGLKNKSIKIFGKDTNEYITKATKLKDNIVSDLKSGKFYNKERYDEALTNASGLGDFDIDFDFDSSFDDFDDSFNDDFDTDESEPNIVTPNVNITSNITKNNPMVQAVNKHSDMMSAIASSEAERDIALSRAHLTLTTTIGKTLSDNIGIVNENLGRIIDFNNTTMTQYTSASLDYYKQSIESMNSILEEIRKSNTVPSTNNKYTKNRVSSSDFFGYDGSFFLSSYIDHVKSNMKKSSDSSMAGSMINSMFSMGMIDTMISNPLKLLSDAVLATVIPSSVDTIVENADKLLGSMIPAVIGKIGSYGDDYSANPILQWLGSVLGINPTKNRVDLSNYERGAVPFDGITRKSIVEVIPTYLSKILAAVSNTEPIIFDYSTGKYSTVSKVKSEHFKDIRRKSLYEYSNLDPIHNAIKGRTDLSDDKRTKLLRDVDTGFVKLGQINGPVDFRSIDGLRRIFNSTKINDAIGENELTDKELLWLINVFKSLDPKDQLRMFAGSDKMASGEAQSDIIRRLQENNPIAMSAIYSGAYDKLESASEHDSTVRVRGADPRLDEIKRLLRAGKAIPEEYKDVELDYEANNLKKEYDRNKGKLNIFKNSKNPITKLLSPIIEPLIGTPLNLINKGINKIGDKMVDLIFGKATEYDDKGNAIPRQRVPLAEQFKTRFNNVKNWIYDKLFGEEGFFTKISNSEWYKTITDKAKTVASKVSDFLFNRDSGLFKGVRSTFSSYNAAAKGYFTNEGGVFDNLRSKRDSALNGLRGFMSNLRGKSNSDGSTPTDDYSIVSSDSSARSFMSTVSSELKQGFQRFSDLIFGPKTYRDGSINKNYVNLNEYAKYAKDNAPDAVANGIIGLGSGAILSSASSGLLSSFILGPIGGAVVGFAGTFLAKSKTFQNLMFGYDDPNTENRIEGFISDKTQKWFKDNKTALIGGAGIGAIGGFMGLGALPGFLLGGPVSGAILGLGTALLAKSKAFQDLMFGPIGEDGNRTGGIIDKVKSKILNRPEIKNKELFGNIGAGTLGGLGLFTLVGLNPIIGATAGLASGIAISSEKWRTTIFGAEDENGKRTGGLLGKIFTGASEKFLKPLLITGAEAKTYLANWFDNEIAGPIVKTADYAFEGIKAVGHKLKNWFSETHFGNFINLNLFSPIKKMFGAVARGFAGVTKMASKLVLKMISTPVKVVGNVIQGISKYLIRGNVLGNFVKWVVNDTPLGLPFRAGKFLISGMATMAKEIFTELRDGIKDTVSSMKESVTKAAKDVFGAIKGKGTQALAWLSNTEFGQNVGRAKTSFIEGVVNPTRERIRSMQNPTMLALQDRERERRDARKQRKADREAALEDFKNRINNTDIASRFGNARDAARAMSSKYGREYNNLSPLERARINTEEQAAQNIQEIRDIVRDRLNPDNNPINDIQTNTDTPQLPGPTHGDSIAYNWGNGSTNWSTSNTEFVQTMRLGPDGKPRPDDTSSIIGPDGKVDQRQLDPETNPNVAEASAGIASGLTNALTQSDSPLASFGNIMSTIGAVFSPFKKYIAIGGLVALGVISLFSNPVKFFTGVINTLVDTLGVLLDPLFRWLDKQGYSRGYQNEYDLDTANELNKILEKNPDAINDVELAKSAVKLYKSTVKQNDKYDKMNVFEKGLTNVMGGYGIFRDKREKKKINLEENEARKAEALGILKFIDSGMSAESLGLTDKDIEQLRKDAAFEASASDMANSTIVSVQNSWLSPEMLGSKLYKFAAQKIGGPTTQNDDVTNALNEYKSEDKSRAVGEPNVPENDTYKLHAGEGVLTASANHLFGGSETTAGLLNAYARTHSMSSDKSALSTILGTVGGSLTTNPNIENAMYADSTDTKDLEKYLTKVREESLNIDDSKYWKFDETSGGKYGGIAKSLFKIVRFANYPARLINNTLGTVADDMTDIELDITGTSSTGATGGKQSLGSKIAGTVKNTFSTIKGWFSGLFDGGSSGTTTTSSPTSTTTTTSSPATGEKPTKEKSKAKKKSTVSTIKDAVSDTVSKFTGWVGSLFGGNGGDDDAVTKPSQKITLGMSSSDYYKFPSYSINSSDINPERTINGVTRPHNGLDLLVQNRSDLSIKSMTNGTVVYSGYSNSYGNMVQIEDENGMYHLYAHMKSLKVKEGDKVQIGTVIGIEGTTGRSTGNHLHYEVGTGYNKGGSLTGRVHPAEYMQGYNSGGTIHATPIDQYTVESFWNGKSGANAQPITNMSGGGSTSTASANPYAGKSILDILYSPVAGFNNALKSLFAPKNANTTETGGTYFATSGTTGLATGNTDPERIWNYLISAGISPNGAAGIMGNLRAESGLRSNNLQDSYEYLGSDTEYTNKVDNGSYAKFSTDRAGYGLAQWTDGGRKANLLKAAKSAGTSISDINMQMDFLMSELGTNYPNLLSLAQSKSSSIKDVSDEMLFDFERPKNAASKSNQRAKYGEEIYRQFTGGLGGSDDYTKDRFTTSHMTPSAQAARVNTNILVVLNKVLTVLNQINGNTSKATDTLTDIRNNTRNQSTTETPKKPTIKSKQPNTSMYDIASNRKKELSNRNYTIAKSIAKGM